MPIQTTVPKYSYAADSGSLDKKDNTEVNTGLNHGVLYNSTYIGLLYIGLHDLIHPLW